MHIILLTLLWIGGIWLGSITNLKIDWWALPGLCLLAAAIPLLFRPELRKYALYFAYAATFFLGGARMIWQQPLIDGGHIASFVDQKGVTLTGLVIEEPDIRDRTINLTVEVEQIKLADGSLHDVDGKILLRTPRFPIFDYGTRLTFTGDLETPFETAEFSYKAYLARQDVYGVMSFPRIRESQPGYGNRFYGSLLQVKGQVQQAINRHVPAPESGLLSGILLGVDHSMPEQIDDDFRTVGITHIVVVSGFNIAIISTIFLSIFDPLFGRHGAVTATLLGIFAFTLLVGADPSVVRAAIMGGIYVVTTKYIGRRNASIPILFFAAWMMTIWNPNDLWDIGFQLSFVATLSLMLFARPLTQTVYEWLKNRLPNATARVIIQVISDAILVTLAAQVLTLPLILFYFSHLSLISILANGFVLPVQPLIMVWGGLMLIASFLLPGLATVLGSVVWVFLTYTIRIARALAQVPFAAVEIPFSLNALINVYALIFGLTWFAQQELEFRTTWIVWLRKNVGQRVAIGGSVIALALGTQWGANRPDGNLHVHFFDVGQGDATLIQTPSGRQILIDGGNFPVLMKQHLGQTLPLWDREIDLLIVTHPDADHVTGLPDLFDRYRFDQLLVAYPTAEDGVGGPYVELLERAIESGAEIVRPTAGDTLVIGDGVQVEVLHPGPTLLEDGRNDNSLSIRLVYGETRLLLTGDAEVAGENAMLAANVPLQAEIYKAGHHGANNASSDRFLDVVKPQLVIVSAGADNRFGHPHPDVLARVQQRGAKVLRTDVHGSIELVSDGESVWWMSEKGAAGNTP